MGPKKKGGEKKAGKASKLAKMNEQERVKYLERKMAEEEETKRRKEEMVSAFMKVCWISILLFFNLNWSTISNSR